MYSNTNLSRQHNTLFPNVFAPPSDAIPLLKDMLIHSIGGEDCSYLPLCRIYSVITDSLTSSTSTSLYTVKEARKMLNLAKEMQGLSSDFYQRHTASYTKVDEPIIGPGASCVICKLTCFNQCARVQTDSPQIVSSAISVSIGDATSPQEFHTPIRWSTFHGPIRRKDSSIE